MHGLYPDLIPAVLARVVLIFRPTHHRPLSDCIDWDDYRDDGDYERNSCRSNYIMSVMFTVAISVRIYAYKCESIRTIVVSVPRAYVCTLDLSGAYQ